MTQLARNLLLKMLQYFEVMLNSFEFYHGKEFYRILIGLCGLCERFCVSSNHVS